MICVGNLCTNVHLLCVLTYSHSVKLKFSSRSKLSMHLKIDSGNLPSFTTDVLQPEQAKAPAPSESFTLLKPFSHDFLERSCFRAQPAPTGRALQHWLEHAAAPAS